MTIIYREVTPIYVNDSDWVNGYVTIAIKATMDNKNVDSLFYVQLNAGRYESQNGCQIHASAGDLEFNEDERAIFDDIDIVELAEQAYDTFFKDNFEDIAAGFNCLINNQQLVVRVNKNSNEAALVIIDLSHSAVKYGAAEEFVGKFDSKEDALEYLKQFRTGEYQDCRGLHSFLQSAR